MPILTETAEKVKYGMKWCMMPFDGIIAMILRDSYSINAHPKNHANLHTHGFYKKWHTFPKSAWIITCCQFLSRECRRHVSQHVFLYSLSSCFWWQPTCRWYHDWEPILVTCPHILQHDICEAHAKLACWDRCRHMSSWAGQTLLMLPTHLMTCCHNVSMLAADMSAADMTWCWQLQLRPI